MSNCRRILSTAGSHLLLAVAAAGAADAQEAGSAITGDAIEEVVVTAQKRAESIQKVPLAVSAVTEQKLARMGADDFTDYARTVPGLSFQDLGPSGIRGEYRLAIRGISSFGGIADTFAYYLDDTPVAPLNPKLFDINRIEVLRGPQGTLYGAGAMGGAIKIITNGPDSSAFASAVDTEISSTEHGGENYAIDGMVNIPLVEDTLAMRAVVTYRDIDGYIDRIGRRNPAAPRRNAVNDEKTRGIRAMLSYTPVENLSIDARVIYQDIEVADHGTFDVTGSNELVKARDVAEPSEEEFTLYSLSGRYDFGGMDLFASSSYLHKMDRESRDITGLSDRVFGTAGQPIALPSIRENNRYTHELRLASTGENRFQWLLGAFYSTAPDYNSIDQLVVDPTLESLVPGGLLVFLNRETDYKEFSAFTDVSLQVTEKLKLGAGVRFFDIEQSQVSTNAGAFVGNSVIPVAAEADGVNPRYVVSYQLTDRHMVYAQAAKGFRPGGGNAPLNLATCAAQLAAVGLDQAPSQYDADSLWSYELGAKTSWFGNRVVANAAIFSIDWTDIQQSIRFPAPCGGGFTGNVGKASSEGYELELDVMATDNLNFQLAMSDTDAVLEAPAPALGGEVGESIIQVPQFTWSASAEYGFPVFGTLRAYVRGDYQYVDARTKNFNQADPTQTLPSYELANARIGLEGKRWEAALFVRNLFDEQPFLADITDGGVPVQKIVTQRPLTIGLNFAFRM